MTGSEAQAQAPSQTEPEDTGRHFTHSDHWSTQQQHMPGDSNVECKRCGLTPLWEPQKKVSAGACRDIASLQQGDDCTRGFGGQACTAASYSDVPKHYLPGQGQRFKFCNSCATLLCCLTYPQLRNALLYVFNASAKITQGVIKLSKFQQHVAWVLKTLCHLLFLQGSFVQRFDLAQLGTE